MERAMRYGKRCQKKEAPEDFRFVNLRRKCYFSQDVVEAEAKENEEPEV